MGNGSGGIGAGGFVNGLRCAVYAATVAAMVETPLSGQTPPSPVPHHGTTGFGFGFTRMIQSPLLKSFTYANPSFGFTTTPQLNAAFF